MGVTANILKTRLKKPTLGRWSSGFSKVKKYADAHKIPIIGVWTNGDECPKCVDLEKAAMTKTFKDWMKVSGCVFWLGTNHDNTKDDKSNGTGFNWARKDKLNWFPFVRVWWKAGKVDYCVSGDTILGNCNSKEGKVLRDAFKKVLKKYDPTPILEEMG